MIGLSITAEETSPEASGRRVTVNRLDNGTTAITIEGDGIEPTVAILADADFEALVRVLFATIE